MSFQWVEARAPQRTSPALLISGASYPAALPVSPEVTTDLARTRIADRTAYGGAITGNVLTLTELLHFATKRRSVNNFSVIMGQNLLGVTQIGVHNFGIE